MTQGEVAAINARLVAIQATLDQHGAALMALDAELHGNGKPGLKMDMQKIGIEVAGLRLDICDILDGQKWITRLVIGAVVLGVLGLVITH